MWLKKNFSKEYNYLLFLFGNHQSGNISTPLRNIILAFSTCVDTEMDNVVPNMC